MTAMYLTSARTSSRKARVPAARHAARRTAAALGIGVALMLSACGGGGGSNAPSTPGVVQITVSDNFGAAVAGATVLGPRGSTFTDAQGVALVVIGTADGKADLKISRDTFVDQTIAVAAASGQANAVPLTLARATAPAGGSMATRSGVLPSTDAAAQQLSFEIELIVVDGSAQPIENLAATDFVLRPCTPAAGATPTHCLRGSATDQPYTAVTAAPETLARVPGLPPRPYAAAVLLDQSGSIATSDATGARLYSTKAFLRGLGNDDRALLAAFASDQGAAIPTPPLTVYGPFHDRASAPGYFSTLDALLPLVGGNTPLYDALDMLRQQLVADASLPAGIAKAVVVFTDGADTTCGTPDACRTRREATIAAAQAEHVRLFTIGLSSGADFEALGELATQTGGAMLFAETAVQLLPLYGSVGRPLNLSLPTYRLRWTVRAAEPGAFQPGGTLLGRVQVHTQAGNFDIPFLVGVP